MKLKPRQVTDFIYYCGFGVITILFLIAGKVSSEMPMLKQDYVFCILFETLLVLLYWITTGAYALLYYDYRKFDWR